MSGNAQAPEPHADDRKTLTQLGDLGLAVGDMRSALEDAYHLGRIRGRLEGVESALSKVAG